MRPRALAIFEVLGVLALGWLLTRLMMQLLPVPPLELELERAIVVQRPAFFRLAILATVPLTVQAACLLLPAHLISRFLRRESFLGSAPGTKECLKGVLLVGLAAFCLFAL